MIPHPIKDSDSFELALAGGIVLISNAGKTTRKIINDYHATFKPKSELAFRPTSNGLGLVLSF